MTMAQAALQLALEAHAGQTRDGRDGEWRRPYFVHPVQVASKLSDWGAANETLFAAALLHDVLEDTDVSAHRISQQFGDAVLRLVEELTCAADRNKLEYLTSFQTASVEALVIKLADRWCNVRDFCRDDPSYAPKYLRKAAPVLMTFQARQPDVETRFGSVAREAIRDDLIQLCQLASVSPTEFSL